jgi:hypothetical protein
MPKGVCIRSGAEKARLRKMTDAAKAAGRSRAQSRISSLQGMETGRRSPPKVSLPRLRFLEENDEGCSD